MKYGFGVDLGGTTVKLAFLNTDGKMLHKWEIPTRTECGGAQILPDIADAVLGYIAQEKLAREDILGIGIGVPGPVDQGGVAVVCDNLGWGRTDVKGILQKLTGLPVEVGNDANMAALGESWMGSGAGCEDLVMVTLGTGVGGGIILGGKPLCGANGAAGEIGHLVLERNETEFCNCGKRGCAEQYCSATGVVRLAKRFGRDYPTCKAVFDAAAAGDGDAQAILEQFYAYLAELTANVCTMLNPRQIIIGGGVSKAGQVILDGVGRHLGKFIYHASTDVEIKLASLGNDAGAYGAFKLICG